VVWLILRASGLRAERLPRMESRHAWPRAAIPAVFSRRSSLIDAGALFVEQVMRTEPYRSASRVLWVVDNGSSHRASAAVRRLRKAYRRVMFVHTPVHAS
jgi:hypothetical protein